MSTTPETPTPTPETEAHMGDSSPNYALYYEGIATSKVVPAKLASKLERERDAARDEIEAMRAAIREAYKIIEVLYMDALDSHKESWPRANEWMQKHAALAKLQPFIK